MRAKVFIDGREGTTGLRIMERFADRDDIELIAVSEEKRKDPKARAACINASDYTFLCLPDTAAREAVSLVTNEHVRMIDASTAHRTNPDWAYGFPELSKEHRSKIAASGRVAVPGCYASGFAACVYPLTSYHVITPDYPVCCHAVSGYSGAGKKAIAVYESAERPASYDSPRQYALSQAHKHLPEMKAVSGLLYEPVFTPIVDDYYSGMVVTVPLHARMLNKHMTAKDVHAVLSAHYAEAKFVQVAPFMGEGVLEDGFLAANTLAGTDVMRLFVYGNDDRIVVSAQLDNLGKGASGAAVQCMNIMMGIEEGTGLVLPD